jgi:hypothetical protein
MLTVFDGLWWLLLMLGPLILLQRSLHKEIQKIFLLVTRRMDIAIVLFSILFFPGVLLHESSHYIMALFLGVRTGGFSLIPRNLGNGRLRLGYIETAKTDFFRDALIGFAPILTGGLFVGYAGNIKLGFLALWNSLITGGSSTILNSIIEMLDRPDFWLWFYLTVVISGTMLPSPADRRSWLPIGIAISLLTLLGVLTGIGSWMVQNIGFRLNNIFRSTAVVFGISAALHLVVLCPAWGIRKIISRLTGLEVKA